MISSLLLMTSIKKRVEVDMADGILAITDEAAIKRIVYLDPSPVYEFKSVIFDTSLTMTPPRNSKYADKLGGTDKLLAKYTLGLAASKIAKIKFNQGFNASIVGNGWQSGLYFEMICNGYIYSQLHHVIFEKGSGVSIYKSTTEACTFYITNNSTANAIAIGVIMTLGTLNSLTQIDALPSDVVEVTG